MKKTHEKIAERLRKQGHRFYANDHIGMHLLPGESEALQAEVEEAASNLLRALVIDVDNDHNSRDTARRLAKMYVQEIFGGRYRQQPEVTDFPNASNLDQLYTVGPIEIRSTCAHHLMPITGHVWVGVHPGDRVLGLSKFHRLADWIFSRPSIQEESTIQLADTLEELLEPQGLGVIVRAKHQCCSHRGVKDSGSVMTTSVVRGTLREYGDMRQEFLKLVGE